MQTFISETLQAIYNKQRTFKNTVCIVPSQRAGVFVKEACKTLLPVGFLPEILNSETFIEEITGLKKIDNVQLLFHFYAVYKECEKNHDTFDSFFSWALTAIQDFNELDQHLINTKEIFRYLKDIERLKNWSLDAPVSPTPLMKNHFSFVEKLGEYYEHFYTYLKDKKIGYQGLIYREATDKITTYIEKNSHKNYHFIGFNALNKAEEYLFQQMLNSGNTDVYWDIDTAFLNSTHQAGTFIRKYAADWKYYASKELQTISSNFQHPKHIEIIGASKNVTQIKYAGEVLQKLPSYNKTAYVLADESLLPITLNSLPKKVEAINITMGYPLKDVPTTSLFNSVFNLFINQEKLGKKDQQQFYFKDVLQFLKHPYVQALLHATNVGLLDEIALKIAQDNHSFISQTQLGSFIAVVPSTIGQGLLAIFNPFENALEFIERVLQLIKLLKEEANPLDKEYLFRFHTIFSQLKNLQTEYGYLKSLKTIHQLHQQLIQSENISFQGEPLQGLQLMGMLETRGLDFENVIITSVNEHILPKSNQQNSFIPFDVKLEFKLPTYKEKDAIFSYHFFRLLQRAKNIYLLYNSENDSFGGGEKSRFIAQLQQLKPGIKEVQIAPKVHTEKPSFIEIPKTNDILIKLKEQAQKGFSPSTLTNYLYNPLDFYRQKILGLKEYKEVEETVAANTMGTIIHDTLDVLYQPFIGTFITKNHYQEMLQKVDDLVAYYFKKHFQNSDIFTGKNRIVYEVSKEYIRRFLTLEKNALLPTDQLKIIATEQDLEASIIIDEFDFPIVLRGQVDRIDELNGVTRIIDYKTGAVTAANLKVVDLSVIAEEKYAKAIQVLLYAFLYSKNFKSNELEGGIVSFKNLKSGVLKVDFGRKDHHITSDKLALFLESIKNLLIEIFNPEIPFLEKKH